MRQKLSLCHVFEASRGIPAGLLRTSAPPRRTARCCHRTRSKSPRSQRPPPRCLRLRTPGPPLRPGPFSSLAPVMRQLSTHRRPARRRRHCPLAQQLQRMSLPTRPMTKAWQEGMWNPRRPATRRSRSSQQQQLLSYPLSLRGLQRNRRRKAVAR